MFPIRCCVAPNCASAESIHAHHGIHADDVAAVRRSEDAVVDEHLPVPIRLAANRSPARSGTSDRRSPPDRPTGQTTWLASAQRSRICNICCRTRVIQSQEARVSGSGRLLPGGRSEGEIAQLVSQHPPLLRGRPVVGVQGALRPEAVHDGDEPPRDQLQLGVDDVRIVAAQQRLDANLCRAHVAGVLGGELRVTDRDPPEAGQQAPLCAAGGVEREQRLEAAAKPAASPLGLVEACAQPVGHLAEGRQQQVALVGEVVGDHRRAAPGRVGDVAERQRIEPVRADQFRGRRGDVSAAGRVVDVPRHRRDLSSM